MNTQSTFLPAFGRLLIAVIFIISGLGKIAAPAMTQGYIGSVGLPAPLFYLLAIVVEIGGGILLVVGFQTRIVGSKSMCCGVPIPGDFHLGRLIG